MSGSGGSWSSFALETIRMSVPYVGAALGGVWSEKSGVANIALEGALLASALGAVAGTSASSSAAFGLLCGVVTGAAFVCAHGILVARYGVNAIVSGLALNLAAAGGTRFVLRALYGSSSNSPTVAGFDTLLGGSSAARSLLDPLTVLSIFAGLASWWALRSTRFGLRVRAVGEDAAAARAVGIDPTQVRILACTIGGALAGLGGAALAFDQHQFVSGMSNGRGFIALAAVIVSGWRPLRACAACLIFAALDALEIVLQGVPGVPHELVQSLPYLATLFALATFVRRGHGQEQAKGAPPAEL